MVGVTQLENHKIHGFLSTFFLIGRLHRIKCWLEELEIEYRFSPEIDKCIMHFNGNCSGNIKLFFRVLSLK